MAARFWAEISDLYWFLLIIIVIIITLDLSVNAVGFVVVVVSYVSFSVLTGFVLYGRLSHPPRPARRSLS